MKVRRSPVVAIPLTDAWPLYRRLFSYIRPYWLSLLIAVIASMLYSGIDSWFVYFLKPFLNQGLVQKDREFIKWAPWLVLAAFMLRGFASFLSNYYIAAVSRRVIMQMRQDLFQHLQCLPAKYYDQHSSGQIISIVLYSVEQVANASADVITTAVQSSFLIMGLLVVMFNISWKLSLLYFVIIPLIAIVMRIASKRVRKLSLSIQQSVAELAHSTEENIEGYKVVRAFGGQTYETDKFNQAAELNRKREMKIVAARAWSVSGVQFIAALALSMTLYVAALDIHNAVLSPGGFVAMVAAMLALLKPLKDLTTMQNKLHRGLAGAQTVFELLDEPLEQDLGKHAVSRVKGKIEFNEVSFSYQGEKVVLQDINFSVTPGEVVALVGHSGSGKTTLINLLTRVYPDYSGTITLDDITIEDYHLADFRQQFSLVSQQVTLFNDTIGNNIAYGKSNMEPALVRMAAKSAYILDFIEELPKGFDTVVGENGVLLSGGQRQRIAIARAILKNAPILILDEATSALDTESERYIQTALDELMKNRTTIVIAHRLSTIERADKIIVMESGRIVEVGSHAALLAEAGYYAKLYKMQFSGENK